MAGEAQERKSSAAAGAPLRPQAAAVAILAGGEGRRIGGQKACVRLGSLALIDYPLAAARAAGLRAVVIARAQTPLPDLDCELLREPDLDPHPLRGVLSALAYARGHPIVVVACDMPFVPAALLADLARARQSTVCAPYGELQPLLGCYHPDAAGELSRALDAGAGARAALRSIDAHTLDEAALARFGDPDRMCVNVNDAEELARASALLIDAPPVGLGARVAAG